MEGAFQVGAVRCVGTAARSIRPFSAGTSEKSFDLDRFFLASTCCETDRVLTKTHE